MDTVQHHSHTLMNIAIAVGLVAIIGGAAFVFFPDLTKQMLAKITTYVSTLPTK
ncbi:MULTISPECIES: DUF2065 family protein [Bacteria]|uniref:DUF2065 family protein n=1 Tax=Enterococcus casseliflavus TaxID=37734 RepID=A0ABD5FPN8_ENTCA|nr:MULTISPECIES: DUF2065 family protein [Enterococcus]MDT2984036.1 DUF2065 family protein [Enterococcus casseliflavus]TPR55465.1 DUF2065 family protein [Enterococcus sp. OL5]TXW91259.1 DUF2065 family protein [Klebsiella pneumoniae]